MATVTVGLPTYNRSDSVERVCLSLLPAVREGLVSVLVVDDGSTDGTHDRLQPLVAQGIRVLRHDRNLGYAQAFITLLENADTDYLSIANDDDRILLDGLTRLPGWLDKVTPALTATQYRNSDPLKVPGVTPTGLIDYRDFRSAASHAPGLVLRLDGIAAPLEFLRDQVERRNTAALVYPQAVIAAWLCVSEPTWWWGESIVEEVSDLPSGIRDPEGLPYWAAKSRVSQALGFHDLFVDLVAALPAGDPRDRARTLLALHARTVYPAVRNALVETGGPASGAALDAATLRQLGALTLRRLGFRR